MNKTLTSQQKISINTDIETVWAVLTTSKYTKVYMFNCSVTTDWVKGSSIIWEGNYEGYDAYQKGEILDIKLHESIKYSTFDPNFGLADKPENYIHVSYFLEEKNGKVEMTIANETFDGSEERIKHVTQGWEMVIGKIKEVAEGVS